MITDQTDGSEPIRLTHNNVDDRLPNFSPDGSKIVFDSTRDGHNAIYIMNIDGSKETRLTNNKVNDGQAAFSPDGSKIVFSSDRDGDGREIYIMKSDGTGQTRLTHNNANDGLPNFSPDGSKIVFNSSRDINADGDEIYIMNADGSGEENLTKAQYTDAGPAFSPDGYKIVFGSNRDGKTHDERQNNYDIYIMNIDGSGLVNLTNGDGVYANPEFSPDGTKIVFDYAKIDGTDREIYMMNVNGSNKIRLTNNNADDSHPVFSPDGSKIAFNSNRDGNWEIYIMNTQLKEGEEDMNLDKIYKDGSTGIGVRFIQKVLNADIKPTVPLAVDGVWSPKMDAIVLVYQKKYGLSQYAGDIGPNTMQQMIDLYPKIWNNIEYLWSIGIR